MPRLVTYGLGGYCENCDPSHDHPLHNLVSDIEIPEEDVPIPLPAADVQVIAEALAALPQEQLDLIKQALGLV